MVLSYQRRLLQSHNPKFSRRRGPSSALPRSTSMPGGNSCCAYQSREKKLQAQKNPYKLPWEARTPHEKWPLDDITASHIAKLQIVF
jgi:hypothetical protein